MQFSIYLILRTLHTVVEIHRGADVVVLREDKLWSYETLQVRIDDKFEEAQHKAKHERVVAYAILVDEN